MKLKHFNDYQISLLPFGDPPITKEELWDIEFVDYRETLLDAANYYIDTLQHEKAFLKVPVGLLFISDREVNARATVLKERG